MTRPPAGRHAFAVPPRRRLVAAAASSTRSTRAASPTSDGDGIGDLRGHHRPPRPPRSGRPRRRRDLAVADLSVAGPRPRLRRQRPHARSTRCSAPRPTSTSSWTKPIAAGSGSILDLVMNHTSDEHPLVRGLAPQHGRAPYADWYLWRDPAGTDAGRPAAAAQRLGVVVRRAGLDLRAAPRASSTTTRSSRSSPSSIGGRRRSRPPSSTMVRAGSTAGSTASASTPSTSSSSIPICRPTRPGAARRPGTARSTSTTSTSRTCRPSSARFRAVVDAAPGPDVGRGAVRRHDRGRGRADDAIAISCSTGSSSPGPGRRRRSASRDPPPRAGVRADDRWPTIVLSNHDQPRHASRLADSIGGGEDDRDAIARAAAVLSLTIRGTPFLYYGEELGMGDVDVPPGESVDARGRHVSAPTSRWWDRSQSRTPMPWTAGHGAGFTTGRRGFGSGRTRDAQRRDPGGRPGLGARLLPTAAPRPGRDALAPGRRASAGADRPPGRPGVPPSGERSRGADRWSRSVAAAPTVTVPRGRHRADLAPRGRHAPRSPDGTPGRSLALARVRGRRARLAPRRARLGPG